MELNIEQIKLMELNIEQIKKTVAYKTRASLYDPEMWDAFEWNEVIEDAQRELTGHSHPTTGARVYSPPNYVAEERP